MSQPERMTAAQLNAVINNPKPKGNKYNAKRVTVDGITFDSDKEARRWASLNLLQRAGKISDLQRQEVIYLHGLKEPLKTRTGKPMRITVDFAYRDTETGLRVYEDAKGMPTRDYEVRRAVAAAQGVEVVEV